MTELRRDFAVRVKTELSDLLGHLKFIDEIGLNLGLTRLYGRAAPGERVTEGPPDYSGPHYTTIAAIGLRGVKAPWIFAALKNRLGLTEIFRAGRGGGAVTRTISARRFPRGLDRSCR